MKLSTTLSHITTVPNPTNSKTISEFYQYMKDIGTSENYQNQNLKAIIGYAKFLGPNTEQMMKNKTYRFSNQRKYS